MSTSGRPRSARAGAETTTSRGGSGAPAAGRDAAARASEAAAPSALADAVARVGDRWTLLVVDALLGGPRRFGELSEAVSGIAPNILTQRLRHLVDEGLVLQRPYSERPPRFEYEVTQAGQELAGALRLLADWGARHAPSGTSEAVRHGVCMPRVAGGRPDLSSRSTIRGGRRAAHV